MLSPRAGGRAAALMVLALSGAACGAGNGSSRYELAATQRFRFPITNDIGEFDPALITAESDVELGRNVFEGLLKPADDLAVVPAIAEKLPEISPDGLTYTFTLKKDITFSNGDPVTAADFIYSWSRVPRLKKGFVEGAAPIVGFDAVRAGSSQTLSGLSAPDDHTLVVKLAKKAVRFTNLVATWSLWVVDRKVVEADPDRWWTRPETAVGTGPFKLSARTPGRSLDFVANDSYRGRPRPLLSSVHVEVVADQSTAIKRYEEGQFDDVGYGGQSTLPPDDALRYQDDPVHRGELTKTAKGRTTWVGLNLEKGPFAGLTGPGLLLRKAFSEAIDRKQLADRACSSALQCTPATGGYITRNLHGYLGDGEDSSARFSPAEARKDLRAGDPDGSRTRGLHYTFNRSDANKAVADSLVSQWKTNLGIDVAEEPLERDAFFDGRDAKGYIAFRHSWGADYDHPQEWYDSLFVTGAASGGSGYSNPKFDSLVQDADGKPLQEALPIYRQAAAILASDQVAIPLVYSLGTYLNKPYVQGAGSNPLFDNYWTSIRILRHSA
ncbi:MAG: ABC transporter substrate-binding protein [Candidatus Dormibacteria bacterium]